eukprot:7389616-Prymnesium_polylepis.4
MRAFFCRRGRSSAIQRAGGARQQHLLRRPRDIVMVEQLGCLRVAREEDSTCNIDGCVMQRGGDCGERRCVCDGAARKSAPLRRRPRAVKPRLLQGRRRSLRCPGPSGPPAG